MLATASVTTLRPAYCLLQGSPEQRLQRAVPRYPSSGAEIISARAYRGRLPEHLFWPPVSDHACSLGIAEEVQEIWRGYPARSSLRMYAPRSVISANVRLALLWRSMLSENTRVLRARRGSPEKKSVSPRYGLSAKEHALSKRE